MQSTVDQQAEANEYLMGKEVTRAGRRVSVLECFDVAAEYPCRPMCRLGVLCLGHFIAAAI